MAQAQRSRELEIPQYPDDGCQIAPSCLKCHLPRCWYEMTDKQKEAYRRREKAATGGKREPWAAARPKWQVDQQKAVALLQPEAPGNGAGAGHSPVTLDVKGGYTANIQRPANRVATDVLAPVQGIPDPPGADNNRLPAVLFGSKSANTRKVYVYCWEKWRSWASANGTEPLPADALHLASFLAEMAEGGASASTVATTRAAVAAAHQEAEVPDPTRAREVRSVVSGLEASNPGEPRQVDGLTRSLMARIKATATLPRTHSSGRHEAPERARERGRVDIALVAVMRDAMLHPTEASRVTWGNITPRRDGSGALHLPRGGSGPGAYRYIGPPTMQVLEAIRPAEAAPRDYVFQLSPKQIKNRIRAAAKAAGVPGIFTGESPRLGMVQDLAALPGAVAIFYAVTRREGSGLLA